MKTAKPAYSEKVRTAGMDDKAPVRGDNEGDNG